MTDAHVPSPLERISELVHIRDSAASLLEQAVRDARREGFNWSDIAAAIGISRQGAHRKFRFVDDELAEEVER